MTASDGTAAGNSRRPTRFLIIETAGWLLFATAAWIATYFAIPKASMFLWGEELWPRSIIFLIFAITVLRFFFEFFVFDSKTEPETTAERMPDLMPSYSRSAKIHLMGTFLLPFVYLYLLPRMGFFILTPFFLSGCMFFFGERRIRNLIGTSLLLYAVALLIFSHFLFVPLPTGYWPGFYDFSNWLLEIIA